MIRQLSATIALATGSALAYTPPVTVIQNQISYRINPDYSYHYSEQGQMRLNTAKAVARFSQIPLSYHPKFEHLTIKAAYTLKPNGEKIPVPPAGILDNKSAVSANAPMYDDSRVKTIIFPKTAPGDRLVLALENDVKPMFPGSVSVHEFLPQAWAGEAIHFTIDAPATMPLYTQAHRFQPDPVVEKNGRKTYHWTLKNSPAEQPDYLQANVLNDPFVFATSLASPQAAADAYLARATDKSAVSPEIQQKAEAITAGIHDPRDQARALYNWVTTNIRYVAVYFGAGGVVPHAAAQILKNGYGDCKDHVTLLSALLAAKGIKSNTVLVNARDTYALPTVNALPGVFDHAITYLPAWNLYLDSTSEVAPFGVLPAPLVGKPALLVDAQHARRVTLPSGTPDSNGTDSVTQITLDAQGNGQGNIEVTPRGTVAWLSRLLSTRLPAGGGERLANTLLQLTGASGHGQFHFEHGRDLSRPFHYRGTFTLDDVFDPSESGEIRQPLGLVSISGLNPAFFATLLRNEQRHTPFAFLNNRSTMTVAVTFPKGFSLSKAPKDVQFKNAIGEYTAHYKVAGQTLTGVHTLTIDQPSPVYPASALRLFKALNTAIARDLRQNIAYQKD